MEGESNALTAQPDSGYRVASWTGTNKDMLKTLDNTLTMPAVDRTVHAEYTQAEYTLNVPSEQGTANRSQQVPYHYGDQVKLTAVPNSSWGCLNRSGDISSASKPVAITIDANKTVTVNCGALATHSLPLASSWNPVAYPAATNHALPSMLADHGQGSDWSLVYFDNPANAADPWKLHDRTAPSWANDLTELARGWGSRVLVSANHTWRIDHRTP